VTKKVGTAVERNRVKRLVREVFRRNRDLFPEAMDVVCIAKKGAPELDYQRVRDELRRFRRVAGSSTSRGRSRARQRPPTQEPS
jgi:ribonuclease P protein component